jgi:putative hydrolase of the HAD superfamily
MASRNVIFDFGGVILRWQPQEIIDAFYEDEALRSALSRNVFRHPDWLEMDRGSLDEETAAVRFASRMSRPVPEIQTLLQLVKSSLVPVPQVIAIVRDLSQRGIPVYGLSNMPASTFAYLSRRYDHWKLFRDIVISGEVKLIKPDPAIFEYICRRNRLEPSETIFVDDHLPNTNAAMQLGFQTILFRNPDQCAHELNALLGSDATDARPAR